MSNLIMIMLVLPLLGCLFVFASPKNEKNAYNVVCLTLGTNILLILQLFSVLNKHKQILTDQIIYTYHWLSNPNIDIVLTLDAFSLLILFGIYISLIIGLVGLNEQSCKDKSLMLLILSIVWNITGFFVAGDIFSFYMFFAGMLLPLFMLIGQSGDIKKNLTLNRFFIFNFSGIICLLVSIAWLCKFYNGSMELSQIAFVDMPRHIGILVWTLVCVSFISRIPIWPFHYWLSSIATSIKNPLVYIVVNIMPLIGLYGFVRFYPLAVPECIYIYVPVIKIFCILTMLFIALISFVNKNFLYKLFSYSTIYYLMFLLAVILPTDTLKMNIAYSLFIFLIVIAAMSILNAQLSETCAQNKCDYRGILAYMPNLSRVFSFFILIAIGLPISSLFWNNFILVSAIFKESFMVGAFVMFTISLISVVFVKELYVMRDLQIKHKNLEEIPDLSNAKLVFLIGIVGILFMSFFNPLWFVF